MQSRTHTCGELRISDNNRTVTIVGWLDNFRELGSNLSFAVIRDYYGFTQVLANTREMIDAFRRINLESTVSVTGVVCERANKNPNMPTGDIEIVPVSVNILGHCRHNELPFPISQSCKSSEEMRLKYRFLDLRNPANNEKITLRCKVISEIRRQMTDRNFLEITTPILTCSSPEGARDFIVPSRIHPGKFYALPQAPQQFKQLLMASGFDRYFQIAPCFRDEDARADRSPGEFYQLDVEMAFASQEDVFSVLEDVLPPVFEKYGKYPVSPAPFRQISYIDAMEKYGSDKPDLRISLLVDDASALLENCGFEPFKGKKIKVVVCKEFNGSRKLIDSICKAVEVESGSAMYWFRVDENLEFVGGVSKFLSDVKPQIIDALGVLPNTFVGVVAGDKASASKAAGVMRKHIGYMADGYMKRERYEFCWIVDFPMYEIDDETGLYIFSHNPFSMPQGGLEALITRNPEDILAYQYDIVCNGIELSSGAVRNHDPDIMIKAFDIVGLNEDAVRSSFPAMFNAFSYGAPPHAGIAPGIDRIVMLIADEPNIREVIPFPMNSKAQDLMMGAPSVVSDKQLAEANISVRLP